MIIAIDGPAASGKGTVGQKLADTLNFAYFDTGLLYRAATKKVIERGISPFNKEAVVTAVSDLTLSDVNVQGLRDEEIGKVAPVIAAIPEVRDILSRIQRDFAAHPPNDARGAVIDGRDIGTVVCPDADMKVFVTASLQARAKRRYKELLKKKVKTSYQKVHKDLRQRDERDKLRNVSPLVPAPDAYILDTTDLTVDEAFAKLLAIIKERFGDRV